MVYKVANYILHYLLLCTILIFFAKPHTNINFQVNEIDKIRAACLVSSLPPGGFFSFSCSAIVGNSAGVYSIFPFDINQTNFFTV